MDFTLVVFIKMHFMLLFFFFYVMLLYSAMMFCSLATVTPFQISWLCSSATASDEESAEVSGAGRDRLQGGCQSDASQAHAKNESWGSHSYPNWPKPIRIQKAQFYLCEHLHYVWPSCVWFCDRLTRHSLHHSIPPRFPARKRRTFWIRASSLDRVRMHQVPYQILQHRWASCINIWCKTFRMVCAQTWKATLWDVLILYNTKAKWPQGKVLLVLNLSRANYILLHKKMNSLYINEMGVSLMPSAPAFRLSSLVSCFFFYGKMSQTTKCLMHHLKPWITSTQMWTYKATPLPHLGQSEHHSCFPSTARSLNVWNPQWGL